MHPRCSVALSALVVCLLCGGDTFAQRLPRPEDVNKQVGELDKWLDSWPSHEDALRRQCEPAERNKRRQEMDTFLEKLRRIKSTTSSLVSFAMAQGSSASSLADEFDRDIKKPMEDMERLCCDHLAQYETERIKVRDSIRAFGNGFKGTIAAAQADIQRLQQEIQRLSDQVAAAKTKLDSLDRQAKALAAKNKEAVLAVLANTDWFDTSPKNEVMAAYLNDATYHRNMHEVKVILTPFGYFMFEPRIRLNSGTGTQRLEFYPVDLFRYVEIANKYPEIKQAQTLTIVAEYQTPPSLVTDRATVQQLVEFKAPRIEWSWPIRERRWDYWLSLREHEYSTTAKLMASGVASQKPVQDIKPLLVEAEGWSVYGYVPYEVCNVVLVVYGLYSLIRDVRKLRRRGLETQNQN